MARHEATRFLESRRWLWRTPSSVSTTTTTFAKIFRVGTFQTRGQAWRRGEREERDQEAGSEVAFEVAKRRWWDVFHVCDDVTEHHDSFLFLAASLAKSVI